MFTPQYRERLRSELLHHAANDERIGGTAITGSAAADREDRWSDIDLAFGVTDSAQISTVVSEFTALMYYQYAALHHHDVPFGAWLYRVFFLPGTLQIDLAFVAQSEFRPLSPTFKLVSGKTNPTQPFPLSPPMDIAGLAWLHALHGRTCILRRKFWQAEYMISATRDHVMSLACIRHGLETAHGRGMDVLPSWFTAQLTGSLVRELEREELWRCLEMVVRALISEINHLDPEFGARVAGDLTEIYEKPPPNMS